MPNARHALIAGLGLIGGSIGIALRRAGWRVSFEDPNVALADARAAGAADDDARDGADVVILATPVDIAVGMLGRAEARPTLGTLVTSVCSVMGPLRAAADAHHVSFVAGHPLAGSEKSGLAAARGEESNLDLLTMFVPLFRDERVFLDEPLGAIKSYAQRFEDSVGTPLAKYVGL